MWPQKSAKSVPDTASFLPAAVAKMDAMPRIIYSLHLDCEREPGEPITGFVVPLNREGNGEPAASAPSASRESWTCAWAIGSCTGAGRSVRGATLKPATEGRVCAGR